MTDFEILKKAIGKAVKNGWVESGYDDLDLWIMEDKNYYSVIFDHNFAKALFGKTDYWKTTPCTCGGVDFHLGGHDMHYPNCDKLKAKRGYKFHLGKMVLKKNTIKYLARFL